jgi:hypothetical protein
MASVLDEVWRDAETANLLCTISDTFPTKEFFQAEMTRRTRRLGGPMNEMGCILCLVLLTLHAHRVEQNVFKAWCLFLIDVARFRLGRSMKKARNLILIAVHVPYHDVDAIVIESILTPFIAELKYAPPIPVSDKLLDDVFCFSLHLRLHPESSISFTEWEAATDEEVVRAKSNLVKEELDFERQRMQNIYSEKHDRVFPSYTQSVTIMMLKERMCPHESCLDSKCKERKMDLFTELPTVRDPFAIIRAVALLSVISGIILRDVDLFPIHFIDEIGQIDPSLVCTVCIRDANGVETQSTMNFVYEQFRWARAFRFNFASPHLDVPVMFIGDEGSFPEEDHTDLDSDVDVVTKCGGMECSSSESNPTLCDGIVPVTPT